MFTDFIKHYQLIRDLLRDCFLYGCFSREELEQKRQLSSRKISYELRRIQQYVTEEYVRFEKDGRYKLLNLSYDFMRQADNFLVQTYRTKSFTRTDLVLYYYILIYLQLRETSVSLNELENGLLDHGLLADEQISKKTLERKLGELCESLGILTCTTEKRTKYYQVAPDFFAELTEVELEELLRAVSLFKNLVFPVTAGYYCERTLQDYLRYERKQPTKIVNFFNYRELHFHPVIEEEILTQLLEAIHQGCKVVLTYQNQLKYPIHQVKLSPYRIRYERRHGRFYLLGFTDWKFRVARLDRISQVKVLAERFERDALAEQYQARMQKSWSSMPLAEGNTATKVSFEIVIDEVNEGYLLEKILAEAPTGEVRLLANGRYRFEGWVNDPVEMIPWLRGYSGYLKLLEPGSLVVRMVGDWEEMLQSYGAL